MKKVTYTVICPFNITHKFPVVLELMDESKDAKSSMETYCPFCDKPVQAEIKGELVPGIEIMRGKGKNL